MNTTPQSIDRNALWLAIGCYSFWGVFPIYWKFLSHIDAQETVMHRVIWAFVFYLIIFVGRAAINRSFIEKVSWKDWALAFASGSLLAGNYGMFIYAVNIDHVLDASLAYFINPLLSVAVGVVLFREAFPALLKFAFIMAFIGVGIQIMFGGYFPWVALLLAATFCAYGVLRKITQINVTQYTLMEHFAVLPIAIAGALWFTQQEGNIVFTSSDWILLAVGGIVTGLPLFLFAYAVQRLPYSLMGMLQFIGPTLNFIVAIMLLGETLDTAGLLSFVFIWGGVGLYLADRVRVARHLRKASNIPLATPEEPR